MNYNPEVWGPHFWFTIFTMALSYPLTPSNVTKKKYYDFIINLPIFLPCEKCGDDFAKLLDKYPVSPYLEGKDSFLKWVHFIHNKINIEIGKDEQTFTESLDIYYELYKPKEIIMREQIKYRKKLLFGVIIVALVGGGYYLYKKFNKKKDLFFMLLVAFCMLLIGTKKALFLLVLFTLFIIYEHRKSLKLKRYLLVFVAGSFILFRL